MTIRDLEIFLAVTEYGTMSRAAEALMISQPSVSLAVSSLEDEFSIELFERSGKKLILTPTGQGLIQYAKNLLLQEQMTKDYLINESHSEYIRIGATATVGSSVVSSIIQKVLSKYPDAHYEVFVANTHIIEEKLLSNSLDIALVEGVIHNTDLTVVPAIRDEMVFICPYTHALSQKESVSIIDLKEERLILREEGSGTRAQIEEQFSKKGLKCNVVWSSYQFSAILEAVSYDLGVSILSKRLIKKSSLQESICVKSLTDANLSRYFTLVYYKNKYFTKIMKEFYSACLSYDFQED